jgi:hypothetical protein
MDHAYLSGAMFVEHMQRASTCPLFPFASLYLQVIMFLSLMWISPPNLSKQPSSAPSWIKMAVWTSCRHAASYFSMP